MAMLSAGIEIYIAPYLQIHVRMDNYNEAKLLWKEDVLFRLQPNYFTKSMYPARIINIW